MQRRQAIEGLMPTCSLQVSQRSVSTFVVTQRSMHDVRDFAKLWRSGACRHSLRDPLDFIKCIDQFVDVHFESVDPRISTPQCRPLRLEAGTMGLPFPVRPLPIASRATIILD